MLRWEDYVERDARKAGEEEDWKKKTRDRGGWKSNQIKSDLFRHHISQKDESGVFTVQTIVSIKHTLIIE